MDTRARRLRVCLGALVILAAFVVPTTASAELPRTYVDASGSDSNDCTRPTPCATFQRAHDQTSPNGEINALTPGNYSSLVINRPITIDGNGTEASITPFGAGITVNLPARGRVILRDIRINVGANLGVTGIHVLNSATVVAEDLRISGGSGPGIRVEHGGAVTRLMVDDTRIHGSASQGIRLAPAGAVVRATIRDTRIDDNEGAAVLVSPTGGGIARATIRGSHIDGNLNGVNIQSAGGIATANVFNTGISDSGLDPDGPGIAIQSNGANATARIGRNEIQHNVRGLQATNGGKILSAGDNDV